MDDFGTFLRAERRIANLTLTDLSEACGHDKSQISRWETGKVMPTAKHRPDLIKIANRLGLGDDKKNELLVRAGLLPLKPDEVNVDARLSELGPERWRKTYFLRRGLEWNEQRVCQKLNIPFWDVKHDLEEADEILALEPQQAMAKEQRQRELQRRQMEHIGALQKLARWVVDSFPELPNLDNVNEFDSFYLSLMKVYRRLTSDAYWLYMADHLGEVGKKLEWMSGQFNETYLPLGPRGLPVPNHYKECAKNGWHLLIDSGLWIIAESGDTREWEYCGLQQRCPGCPDQHYEQVDMPEADANNERPLVIRLPHGAKIPESWGKLIRKRDSQKQHNAGKAD